MEMEGGIHGPTKGRFLALLDERLSRLVSVMCCMNVEDDLEMS